MTKEEKIAKIREFLAQTPESNGTDAEISAALNDIDPTLVLVRHVPVRCSTARGLILAAGEWRALAKAAELEGPVGDAAFTCLEALRLQEELSTEIPEMYTVIEATMAGLVAGGVFDSGLVGALMALANQEIPRSWADANVEGRYVSPEDVAAARI